MSSKHYNYQALQLDPKQERTKTYYKNAQRTQQTPTQNVSYHNHNHNVFSYTGDILGNF